MTVFKPWQLLRAAGVLAEYTGDATWSVYSDPVFGYGGKSVSILELKEDIFEVIASVCGGAVYTLYIPRLDRYLLAVSQSFLKDANEK